MEHRRLSLPGLSVAAFLFCVALAACGGGSKGGLPPVVTPAPVTHRALVIGAPSGSGYDAIRTYYSVLGGTGSEDPSSYDMLVVDAKSSDPVSLHANPALDKFLSNGKMLVVLNSTDAQRDTILKGHLVAHARGTIDAAAFFVVHSAPGVPPRETEIDFPVRLIQEPSTGCAVDPSNPCPVVTVAPSATTLKADERQWIDQVQQRFAGAAQSVIPSPSPQPGQAAFSYDVVQPLSFQVASYVNGITPPQYGFFGGGSGYWCNDANGDSCGYPGNPGANQPNFQNTESGTFESSVSVLLQPNGGSFQHKVILRQYSLVIPNAFPNANWQYPYYQNFIAYNYSWPVRSLASMLGFNVSTWLRAGTWTGMAIAQAAPANANNTTTLTTSYTHSEGVALSASADTDPTGTVGANWSDSWAWQSMNTVNIQDWTVQQSGGIQYVYTASGNTPDTYDNLITYQKPYYAQGTYVLKNDPNSLNNLERGNMVAQSETDWISTGGPVGPNEETVNSSTEIVQGEVYSFQHCGTEDYGQKNCDPSYYGATPSFAFLQNISIDFGTAILQPPTLANFSLSFSPWPNPMPQQATITGTVTIPSAAANPGPINLSYVVEPVNTILTLPSGNACPGNQYQFQPGNNVISNGSPPFSITIPQGQTSATFPITVQALGSPFNIQVVAWQSSGTAYNGATAPNVQSAWCLTVPG